ncbi:MAG: PAS domain-containing protein, partial [Alphaproteobacteria bacterium]
MNDFEAEIAHDERLLSLYRYWSDKRRDRSMPARADLAVPELKPWLGFLNLVDVSHDPLDFRYRVFG